MSSATPRINGHYLSQYIGTERTVRVMAKIHAIDNHSGLMQITTSDKSILTVQLSELARSIEGMNQNIYRIGGIIECVAKVNKDGTLSEWISTSMGDNFGQPRHA